MLNLQRKEDCCGCNACGDICPTNAITFKTDLEGFWYPEIDSNLCIDCGLCDKTCPILHVEEFKTNKIEKPKCFAAINKNLEVRFDSTSGGMFSALSDKMYKDGGFVGGAIFNPDFSVKHYISNDKKDLEKLRSSKYLQSSALGFYREVKSLLKNNEKVLVCGTPCQMVGLRSFLGKEYENLIIVDFICLGINSPKIFRKYLDYLEHKYMSKVVYFKSKNKELGWRQLTSKIIFENGDICYDTKDTNYFTRGYLETSVYSRPSCYKCKFKGFPRTADITIADFWGVENVVGKHYDMDLGTSLVMINSEKGKEYYSLITKQSIEVSFEAASKGNRALFKSLNPPTVDRDSFFRDLNNLDFKYVVEKYIKRSENISLKKKAINLVKFCLSLYRHCGFNVFCILKNLHLNFLKRSIRTNIFRGKYIIVAPHTIVDIKKGAKVEIKGCIILGEKKFKSSKLETRLLVEKGAEFSCGNFKLGYGSDIEVFSGARLVIEGDSGTNTNATIICGEEIIIKKGTMLGRDVTIRDNNGNHYISRRGYKNTRPIVIGQHSWLCEGCTIMLGTKLGVGVIVGAKAYVPGGHHKSHTLLMGNPATIVDEDVYWKY